MRQSLYNAQLLTATRLQAIEEIGKVLEKYTRLNRSTLSKTNNRNIVFFSFFWSDPYKTSFQDDSDLEIFRASTL
jgi:hypothetical protein